MYNSHAPSTNKQITKQDIYNSIRNKEYDKLDAIFANSELYQLLSPPTWSARMRGDVHLLEHACKSELFIRWLVSNNNGSILIGIAFGTPGKSDQENKIFVNLIKEHCEHLMSDKDKKVLDYLCTQRGYEEDLPTNASLSPLSP